MGRRIPLKFNVEDIRGVMAVLPTPSTPDASSINAKFTVDLTESKKMLEKLIVDGIDGIMTNGTLGEMATLTLEEWKSFTKVVAQTVQQLKPDLPLFIGATTLGTRETLERIQYLHDLGVRGLFLGRPFWNELGSEALINFYQDIANSFPDMSIVLYDNPEVFKGSISTSVYKELAKIPQIIGTKYIALTPKFKADMEAVAGNIRLMPLDLDWFQAYALYPEEVTACWSSNAVGDPAPVIALRDLLQNEDFEEARELSRKLEYTNETFLARVNFPEFSKYNISLEKIRFDEAGYVKAGPARSPYHIVPESYAEGARETGRRWRALAEQIRMATIPSGK